MRIMRMMMRKLPTSAPLPTLCVSQCRIGQCGTCQSRIGRRCCRRSGQSCASRSQRPNKRRRRSRRRRRCGRRRRSLLSATWSAVGAVRTQGAKRELGSGAAVVAVAVVGVGARVCAVLCAGKARHHGEEDDTGEPRH